MKTLNYLIIPKEFWKYYDLYRRKIITLFEFSQRSGLKVEEIAFYLNLA